MLADPKFPYKTIIDRVITDEKGNILFGENPGNVYDAISDDNQKDMIQKLQQQINNQQTMINRMQTQIDNQEAQIARQEEQIDRQDTQISNQEIVIMRLQSIIDENVTQTTNQQTIISNQSTQISNQDEIISRLEQTFDVVVNGNIMEVYGSSSDTKPTGVKVGTTFFEHDTGDVYMYTGSTWVVI